MTAPDNNGSSPKRMLRRLTINRAKKDRKRSERDAVYKALMSLTNVELEPIAANRKDDFIHQKAREILNARRRQALEQSVQRPRETGS